MRGTIFAETLRRSWRGMVIWGGALAVLTWFQVIIVPNVESIQQVAEIMETMPPFFLVMFGGGDLEFMATPEGYLALQFFSIMLLILAVYAVIAGMNVSANDEERGIMDVQMSLPIRRGQLIIEKTLAHFLMMIGVIALTFMGLYVGVTMLPEIAAQVRMGRMVEGMVNMIPGALVMIAFTVFMGTVARRRGLATGAAAVFVVGSYFLDAFGRSAPGTLLDTLRVFSFYSYYDSTVVIQNGLLWGNVLLLLALAAALTVAGAWRYERRDIGL